MLEFDLLFLLLNLFPLVRNLLMHALSLLLLVGFVLLHVFLKITFQLFHIFDLDLLLLQLRLCLFQLLMFVPQSVNLSLEFVRLLLLNHTDVSCRDLLEFGQTTVAQSVTGEVQLNEVCVFI